MLFSVQVDTDLPPTSNRKYSAKDRLVSSPYTLPRAYTRTHSAHSQNISYFFAYFLAYMKKMLYFCRRK